MATSGTAESERGNDEPSVDARVSRLTGDGEPAAPPQMGIRRRPRPEGDTAALPQVQIALGLLLLFLFLLVLWVAWPFLSGGS